MTIKYGIYQFNVISWWKLQRLKHYINKSILPPIEPNALQRRFFLNQILKKIFRRVLEFVLNKTYPIICHLAVGSESYQFGIKSVITRYNSATYLLLRLILRNVSFKNSRNNNPHNFAFDKSEIICGMVEMLELTRSLC